MLDQHIPDTNGFHKPLTTMQEATTGQTQDILIHKQQNAKPTGEKKAQKSSIIQFRKKILLR